MSAKSPTTQSILECLQATAEQTLDRKRRLGQYAVIWEDGRVKKLIHSFEPSAAPLNEEKGSYNAPKER